VLALPPKISAINFAENLVIFNTIAFGLLLQKQQLMSGLSGILENDNVQLGACTRILQIPSYYMLAHSNPSLSAPAIFFCMGVSQHTIPAQPSAGADVQR
jgi:hypothetical protein